MAKNLYGFMNIVDNGTTYHSISLVCEGRGTPRSLSCFAKLQAKWCAWAGYPKVVTTDRGLHKRGELSRGMTMNGTYLRQAGSEAPEQTGRGERHGGIIKSATKAVIKEHHVIGKDQMKPVATIAQEGKKGNVR